MTPLWAAMTGALHDKRHDEVEAGITDQLVVDENALRAATLDYLILLDPHQKAVRLDDTLELLEHKLGVKSVPIIVAHFAVCW